MANEDSTLTEVFTDIADAIRAKGNIPDTVKMSSLEMPAVISALPVIDPEDYYEKSETSSAAEISDAFANVSVDMSGYYTKSETSSAAEISDAVDRVEAEALSASSDAGQALQKAEKVQTTLDSDFKLTERSGEYEGGGTFRKLFWTYQPRWFTMTNAGSENQVAKLGGVGTTLEYSLDGGSTWTAYTEEYGLTVAPGASVKFRNNGVDSWISNRCYVSKSTGLWNVSGNIMTLIDQSGMSTSLAGMNYAFGPMFKWSIYGEASYGIVDASKL